MIILFSGFLSGSRHFAIFPCKYGNTIPCWEQQVFFFLLFIGFRLRIEWRSICPVYSTLDAAAIWPIDFIRSSLIFLLWLHFLLHIHIFVVVADPAMNRADVKVDLTKKTKLSLSAESHLHCCCCCCSWVGNWLHVFSFRSLPIVRCWRNGAYIRWK